MTKTIRGGGASLIHLSFDGSSSSRLSVKLPFPRNRWWRVLLLILALGGLFESAAFLACRWYDRRHPRDRYVAVVEIARPRIWVESRLGVPGPAPDPDPKPDFARRLAERGVKIWMWEPDRNSDGSSRLEELIVISDDGKKTAEIVRAVIAEAGEAGFQARELRDRQDMDAMEAAVNDPQRSLETRKMCAEILRAQKAARILYPATVRLWESSCAPVNSFIAIHRQPFHWLKRAVARQSDYS